jgi:hypothetical protein
MDAMHATLKRLRDWFLVWFVFEAVLGTAAAAYVLDGMGRHWFLRYAVGGVGSAGTVLAAIVVSLILLLLAWAVLDALQQLQPWARTVMLVIGWITVISAALNLLLLPGSAVLLEPIVALTGGDRAALMTVSALARLADLAFWSWAIYVLQANADVREAFDRCRSAPAGSA